MEAHKGTTRISAAGRTIWGVGIALFLTVVSYLSFFAFVHTYCENRPVMVVLAVAGMGTVHFVIRGWPLTVLSRVVGVFAILLCLLEITFNVWYFGWATRVCAEQKRLLVR